MRFSKTLACVFFQFSLFTTLHAQQKTLTMEEAVLKQKTSLSPARIKEISWIKGGGGFSFTCSVNPKTLMACVSQTAPPSEITTLKSINLALRAAGEDSLPGMPSVTWQNNRAFTFMLRTKKISFDIQEKKVKVLFVSPAPPEAENEDESPEGNFTAYTVGNNLFVHDTKSVYPVTSDSEKNIVNGHSVHREEFGIYKGTFWSPHGNLLAFYRMDQTMVTDYPILDLTARPASARFIKYPMAGDKSHEVTLGIYNVKKHSLLYLKTGTPKEQYLTNIAWSPDEQHVYIAVLNRDQNHLWLNVYNAQTGDFEKTLFEETDPRYVHPLHPAEFVPGHSGQFIWQSQRSGANNLYLYDLTGKLIRQLTGTDGYDSEVTQLIGMDANGTQVFYQSISKANPLGRVIRSVSLTDGKSLTLTPGEGTHSARLSENGIYLIDTWSSIHVPRRVTVLNGKGEKLQALLDAPDPLKEYELGTMKMVTLQGEDKTTLYCRMILPVNFDSAKKYPVIDYLYGGPNVQLITDTWIAGSDLWYQYMAEHGYIVFTLDNRGSSGRGKAFEQATFRHLGKAEMEDQLRGVEYLKSLHYVDASRLGVFGWSFGGFMTTSLMTRHPGVFKAAVAGGPVIDWSYYEVMYTERYMDTPQDNKEGYAENSLLNYADKLQGKLLLIHGTADDVVVWQHSLMFLNKCISSGTQPDYFVYPGHLHNVSGKDRIHLFEKITAYFGQNL